MTESFTSELRMNLETKYGKIMGRNTKNSKLFRHTGNWAYKPSMFFCTNIKDAVKTAMNIEASLYEYNESKGEWMEVFDIDYFCEYDEYSKEIIDINLEVLGYKHSIFKGGNILRSAYVGWSREDIPDGAYELAPGLFI